MPIHDLSYEHWAGDWTTHPYRWWVVTRQGIVQLAKKRLFLVLLFLSLVPFLVRCVILYGAVVMNRISFIRIDAQFFEAFLSQWPARFFTFIIAIYAGAGLIANDLKANALQIYFSKAITRRDYLIGKLGVVAFFVALPTLVAGLLLFAVAVIFHSDFDFLRQYAWVLLSILIYGLLIVFVNSMVILALSSLSRSSRFAGIFFAAAIFFSQIFYGSLSLMLRTTSVAWVSVPDDLIQVGNVLFRSPLTYQVSPWICAAVLAVVLAGSAWIIYSRVRAVEVVK